MFWETCGRTANNHQNPKETKIGEILKEIKEILKEIQGLYRVFDFKFINSKVEAEHPKTKCQWGHYEKGIT